MKNYIVIASTSIKGLEKMDELKRFANVFGYIKQNVDIDVVPVVGCFDGEFEQSMAFNVSNIDEVKVVCQLFTDYEQQCILVGNKKTRDAFLLNNEDEIKWCGKLVMSTVQPEYSGWTLVTHNGIDVYIYAAQ